MAKNGSARNMILGFIASHPNCSQREIADFMGYGSTAPVHYHVHKLKAEGLVTYNPKIHRSLRVK
jgi:predicted transcriptional regulator